MKYIISERQYGLIKEEDQEILEIPSLEVFGDDWDLLQRFLERRGNPPYSIGGDLDLRELDIESLGNLVSVKGNLLLSDTKITSLGNLVFVGGELNLYGNKLTSLENLTSVGGHLVLSDSKIISLGNLVSVGKDLYLGGTPISKTMSRKEIRAIVNVGGDIYL